MPEYIDRVAFIRQQREWYCKDCDRRKGIKNGKIKICYEIGDAPCRACRMNDVLESLEDFETADVQPVKRGEWNSVTLDDGWGECQLFKCSLCGGESARQTSYCRWCGATMEVSDEYSN